MKTSIVIAYRKEEADLQDTIHSAAASAGKTGTRVLTVEDKANEGPGRTRDRGIMAADGSDVIIILDAHMRFQGDVLRRLARAVLAGGGLLVPFCHHNEACDLESEAFYAGGRILYRVRDLQGQKALDAKWGKGRSAGPVGCVMGACYAFPRSWYLKAGRPLACLPGWGGDEQALSIAAWLTGVPVEVFDGHVAHRYRASAPWPLTDLDIVGARMSRAAVIRAFVPDACEQADLELWAGTPRAAATGTEKAIERIRAAMAKAPRRWDAWKAQVCEPGELDGEALAWVTTSPKPQAKRHTANKIAATPHVECPHCHALLDPFQLRVSNSYATSRRFGCPECHRGFIIMRSKLPDGLK